MNEVIFRFILFDFYFFTSFFVCLLFFVERERKEVIAKKERGRSKHTEKRMVEQKGRIQVRVL